MGRKSIQSGLVRKATGVSLSPFSIFVIDKEVSRSGKSRSDFINGLATSIAKEKGYKPDSEEFISWMRDNGFLPTSESLGLD